MCQSDHMIGGFFCKLSRNPFLLDDIISALCDTQTRQESNSLCITSKGIMETKTNVLRVKYEIICTVKNISLNVCKELLGIKSCLYHNNQRRLTCSWKKEYRKKITFILTTILNSIHGIWLDVLNDHVFTYFFKDQPYF